MIQVSTTVAIALLILALLIGFGGAWLTKWLMDKHQASKKRYQVITQIASVVFLMPMKNWENLRAGRYGRFNEIYSNAISYCHNKYFTWLKQVSDSTEKETMPTTAVIYFVLDEDAEEYNFCANPIELSDTEWE